VPYLPETRKAWMALWADPVSSALTPADRPVLLRWVDALDRAQRHLALGDEDPIVPGHANQPVESPHYGIADKALRVAAQCEQQLGVGALNRARLGIAVLQERASLDELNARLRRPADAPGRPDPRVVPGNAE
jgi:P27 family predicted phage terminase small subunit